MDKVQGVSLPRCGHNLLVKHLQRYFGSGRICPDYRKRLLPFVAKAKMRKSSRYQSLVCDGDGGPDFHYCEYYYSCRRVPCCDARNSFQKSHDFHLKLPANPEKKYLVQSRNSLGLLISWYELRLPRNRETDSPQGFVNFAKRVRPYLEGFRRKWIDSELPCRIVINYEDYLEKPEQNLVNAIRHFLPDQPINIQKLREVVRDVRPAKDDAHFRYFDAAVSTGFLFPSRSLAS